MKKTFFIITLLFSVIFSGCDSEDARNYAKELVGVLKTYKAEINKKIKAEQQSYKDLSATYAYAKQMDVKIGLQTDRLRRASEITDRLLNKSDGDKEITTSDISNMVLDYANSDFDKTRQMLERETNDQSEFLTGLETLELQAQNIDELIKVLEELAKPKSNLKQLKDLALAAKTFKDRLNELECEDIERQIACLQKKKDSAETPANQKEKIQAEIDRLQKQMNDTGCKNKGLVCPESK